jgi:hypothetical protein
MKYLRKLENGDIVMQFELSDDCVKLKPCARCGSNNIVETRVDFKPAIRCNVCHNSLTVDHTFEDCYMKELATGWNQLWHVHSDEPVNENLTNYKITLCGCHDDTYFNMQLDKSGYELLKRVSELSVNASDYGFMPTLHIEKTEQEE